MQFAGIDAPRTSTATHFMPKTVSEQKYHTIVEDFRGFFRFVELFSNIRVPGKVPRLRANSVDNASARRIDPRYPEVQISISKFSKFQFFDRYFLANRK